MRLTEKMFYRVVWACVIAMFVVSATLSAFAQQEIILYTFNGPPDGQLPWGSLVADASGNLYGTTANGGAYNVGTVFKLAPPSTSGGSWTETILYSFGATYSDGVTPQGNLLIDGKGNLYGTTWGGGTLRGGIVFELSPPAISGNPWTMTQLHNFPLVGTNAASSPCGLLAGKNGQIFGSSINGGLGYGSIFVLSPPLRPRGPWTLRTLYTFTGYSDGADPQFMGNPLAVDAKGNLYGTASIGGSTAGLGTVFELSPPPHYSGSWIKTDLHSFGTNSADGWFPQGGVAFDASGNLYGTTYLGGSNTEGTIFELAPAGNGTWTENILYNFGTVSSDGDSPRSNVVIDSSGNLYGSADQVIWKLTPPSISGGAWTESILHTFINTPDGSGAVDAPIFGPGGALYGVTAYGGNYNNSQGMGNGIVYEIIP